MSTQTLVFFVCSPSARVGKTTTARLIADYFVLSHRPVRVIDTDPHESVLAGHFPDHSVVADLSKVQGQMAVFDGVLANDGVTKVIDIWHRSYDVFFQTMEQIEFMEEAERVGVLPIFTYVADPSLKSFEGASRLARRWPEAMLIIVDNEGAAPLGENVLDELARFPSARTFEIPALNEVMRTAMEEPDFSFSRFVMAPPSTMSIVVRAGLRSWLSRIFAQFQNFELRMAMDAARYLR